VSKNSQECAVPTVERRNPTPRRGGPWASTIGPESDPFPRMTQPIDRETVARAYRDGKEKSDSLLDSLARPLPEDALRAVVG